MSVEARKQALERRHAALESQLQNLTSRPRENSLEAAALKREKLRLKDEIVRIDS